MQRSAAKRLIDAPMTRLSVWLGARLVRVQDAIARATMPEFATEAPGVVIKLPREIRHPERMYLGSDVKLGPSSVLKVTTEYPGGWLRHPAGDHVRQEFDPTLHIGDRVTATAALQVVVYERVHIEDDVLFAANVYVSDGSHATIRGDVAYKFQGIERIASVHIGRGAWIGQNVVIMPGVNIGEFAVIGANSVVSGDVPANCVAVGAPARVVRRWNLDGERWDRVEAWSGTPAASA